MFITFETYAGGQLCFSCSATSDTFFFINPRALFCHCHIKCHSINIHKILDGNSYFFKP